MFRSKKKIEVKPTFIEQIKAKYDEYKAKVNVVLKGEAGPDPIITKSDKKGAYIYWQIHFIIGVALVFFAWLVYLYLIWKYYDIYGLSAIIATAIRAAIPSILYGVLSLSLWYEFFRRKGIKRDQHVSKSDILWADVRSKRAKNLIILFLVWITSIYVGWFLMGVFVNVRYFTGGKGWVFELLFGSVFLAIGISLSYLVSRVYDQALKARGISYAMNPKSEKARA